MFLYFSLITIYILQEGPDMISRKMIEFAKRAARELRKRKTIKKEMKRMRKIRVEIVQDYDCATYGSNSTSFFAQLAQTLPLKLVNCALPVYENPHKVEVLVNQKGFASDESDYIAFQSKGDESPQFTSMPFSVFQNYKGKFDLSVPQMKLDVSTVELPHFVSKYFCEAKGGLSFSSIQAVNLWYYKTHKISTWHYDGHDNFLFVKQGNKIVHLLPPSSPDQKKGVCSAKSVFNINSNHAAEDDFHSFLRGAQRVWKVEVSEGECLFIPRGWWHYVQSMGCPTVAINVWGNSLKKQLRPFQEEMMLKHLVLQMSDKMCMSTSDWELFPQELKMKYRQAYFMRYFSKVLQKDK